MTKRTIIEVLHHIEQNRLDAQKAYVLGGGMGALRGVSHQQIEETIAYLQDTLQRRIALAITKIFDPKYEQYEQNTFSQVIYDLTKCPTLCLDRNTFETKVGMTFQSNLEAIDWISKHIDIFTSSDEFKSLRKYRDKMVAHSQDFDFTTVAEPPWSYITDTFSEIRKIEDWFHLLLGNYRLGPFDQQAHYGAKWLGFLQKSFDRKIHLEK